MRALVVSGFVAVLAVACGGSDDDAGSSSPGGGSGGKAGTGAGTSKGGSSSGGTSSGGTSSGGAATGGTSSGGTSSGGTSSGGTSSGGTSSGGASSGGASSGGASSGGASSGGASSGGASSGGASSGGASSGGASSGGASSGGASSGGASSGGTGGGGTKCGKPVCFEWPLGGSDAKEWVINNYVDLDKASGGLRDYKGATGSNAKTYDGHNGIDIDVPSFRAMDADFPVLAGAAGKVTGTHDGEFDRNISCASNNANYVIVEHSDGTRAHYYHLKKSSIVVAVGAQVTTGQKLGVVGSSGCSTAPHLHFEVRSAGGAVIDPFEAGLWNDPPVYDTPLGFMDGVLKDGAISGVDELKDPKPNITTLTAGKSLGVGMSTGGGKSGDTITVRYVRPDATFTTSTLNFSGVYRHAFWIFGPATLSQKGPWKIEIRTNGTLSKTYPLTVN